MHLPKSFIYRSHYNGLSSRYKRPIVTSCVSFKITTVMEKPSGFGNPPPSRSPWEPVLSVMPLAKKKGGPANEEHKEMDNERTIGSARA